VYTAIYGGFDELIEPVAQDIDVDWICFTDDASLRSDTWRVIVEPAKHEDPRLAAKWPKMLPDHALPDHRWTIWVDANLAIDSPSFVREALTYQRNGIALFRHPQRYCIYHEAFACLRRTDCRVMPVIEQVRSYRDIGHPPRSGLYACGVIVRDGSDPVVRELGQAWLDECLARSPRDQLSFPVLLARIGLDPGLFPFHIGRAPWWLAVARYFGLTPGSFPTYLVTSAEARSLCRSAWFPPFATFPVRIRRTPAGLPITEWRGNPWFEVRRHSQRAAAATLSQ